MTDQTLKQNIIKLIHEELQKESAPIKIIRKQTRTNLNEVQKRLLDFVSKNKK